MKSFKKARKIALSNNQGYHIVAILIRNGIPIKFGTNQAKTHPIAHRVYSNGEEAANMHAEMDVLRYAKSGDSLRVMRFLKNGKPTMAKPCRFCLKLIQKFNLNSVQYTNWNGEWEEVSRNVRTWK